MAGGAAFLEEKQVQGRDCGSSEHGVGHHVHDDVRSEPGTLQRRHHCLRVDFRFEEIHADEDGGEKGAEGKYPLVSLADINDEADEWEEE